MKKTITIHHYQTPCGELVLGSLDDRLCLCDWHPEREDRRLKRMLNAEFAEGTSEVIERAARQLDEYFAGERRAFDLPLMFAGTKFQETVWNELLNIPYGQTISYGELAARIGSPKAVRAVANANGANSISIFAPCHRVIGSDGTLTGYGGGLQAKQFLLNIEGAETGKSI
ncbi:MAG: methylated-DNA--[protein]-cysteine S-methyltransferase [Staphylococcus sp.]|nr:methylated-DNA--[protein]-cysteine S-methyltransferase [Staphylococcus sp.]